MADLTKRIAKDSIGGSAIGLAATAPFALAVAASPIGQMMTATAMVFGLSLGTVRGLIDENDEIKIAKKAQCLGGGPIAFACLPLRLRQRRVSVQNPTQNRAMKPAGVHHVAICVADAQKGLAFYRDVHGMTQLPRPDLGPGYWLDAGGQQVHLMESDTQPPGANHFAIRVDDIDAAVTDLREQGVEVHRIPLTLGAGHQAFLHDPFGNLLELNQPE